MLLHVGVREKLKRGLEASRGSSSSEDTRGFHKYQYQYQYHNELPPAPGPSVTSTVFPPQGPADNIQQNEFLCFLCEAA